MDLFSVDASFQHEEGKARRHASVLSHARVTERFEPFLKQAADRDDFELRLALAENDIRAAVTAACDEAGHGDVDAIYATVVEHIAGGAFCDDCRKWKAGPKAGTCTCGEDKDGDGVDDHNEEKTSAAGMTEELNKSDVPPAQGQCTKCNGTGEVGESDCPACHGTGKNPAKFGFHLHAEDSLGGKGKGSGPAMDKSNAGDERGNKKTKVPETDGGRYKTVHQDIEGKADYTNQDFLEQTEAVTDHNVDVTKGSESSGENKAPTTWGKKPKQAQPITSSFYDDDYVSALSEL